MSLPGINYRRQPGEDITPVDARPERPNDEAVEVMSDLTEHCETYGAQWVLGSLQDALLIEESHCRQRV